GASDFVTIDISNQAIKKIGKSTYAITHNLSASTNNDGVPGTIKLFILLVWEKSKGKWQLIARQATRV
ncbi:MAG TPA: nuclear transport factor 2 family protein, partial [Saprospiraceae bacterium]|nr:nuclear transport factor 2 family protein [Saprospiraceae bacterium]